MDNLSGMQFGPYHILRPIGMGGMAMVYRAEWLGHNMEVALKVLSPQLVATPELVARFKREAEALARLQHPNILPLVDYGEFGGQVFMALQLMPGGSLAERIKARGVMPLPEIQKVIAQVGDALGYAHQRGLVHRDVKPANVLIDGQGNYCLTDFGIAKIYEATAQYTKTGMALGTPTYMSPEQVNAAQLDGRSDLYSLGIVLYEMATGRVPFDGDTPFAVAFMHVQKALPAPRSLNPAIPPKLEKVIQKALAKKPGDRYQNMGELIKALQAVGEANIIPPSQQPKPTIAQSAPQVSQAPPAPTPTATKPVTPAKPLTPPNVAAAKPVTPPPAVMTKPITPPPAALAKPTPAKPTTLPGWLWAGGAVLGLLILIACVASLFAAALPGAFAPPTATPSRTPPPLASPTSRRSTATPKPEVAASATPVPIIWQIINNAPANVVAQGEPVVAPDGTPLLLSITDLETGNASHLHLLSGVGAVTLAQDQVVVNLEPDSDAFINSAPFAAGVMFKPQLANYPDLAFAGQGCLATAYDAAKGQLVLGCYAGTCQYVITQDLGGWIPVTPGKQVVITLDNMATKVGNLTENARARYRAVLTESDLGKEDEVVCLGSTPVATSVVQPTTAPTTKPVTQPTNTPSIGPAPTNPPALTNTSVPPTSVIPSATPPPPTITPFPTDTPILSTPSDTPLPPRDTATTAPLLLAPSLSPLGEWGPDI